MAPIPPQWRLPPPSRLFSPAHPLSAVGVTRLSPASSAGFAFYWPPARGAVQSKARKSEATCSTPLLHPLLSVVLKEAGLEGSDHQSEQRGSEKGLLIG